MSNISSTIDALFSNDKLFLLAGPCVVENEALCMQLAEKLKKETMKLDIPYVFKASYRKANRTKLDSFTGIGDEKALRVLEKVRREFDIPVVTDIHESSEAASVGEVVDVLQIPAFLFRQTELLLAAGRSGKVVNVKKGQFAAANSMQFAAEKIKSTGNDNILLTERGTMFGYSDMIVDMRNIPWMQAYGYPVVMDCTHALQQPNDGSGVTGGLPEMIESLAKAAVSVGVNGLFLETHPNPKQALSDGANMIALDKLGPLLQKLIRLKQAL